MDINENAIDIKTEEKISVDLNESNNNYEMNKEVSKPGAGDFESSHSESSKAAESREDRIKRLKEQSESERQRKLAEIMESQKLSHELRQKQQMERRKKIEELKLREEERRKGVEQRRRELDEKEKEKNENIQKRNKEREARAARLQKPLRAQVMSSSMSQSMISPRQNRMMTASVHSSGTSSGSEKCMKKASYGRWPSSCDVDRVSSCISPAAGKASSSNKSRRSASNFGGKRQLQPPEGFLEVDGHFIPASTRHVGCFLPYKGPQYRVKGVLAWGPPPPPPSHQVYDSGAPVAWWASLEGGSSSTRGNGGHKRASSAHNSSYVGSHGIIACPSIPCNIDQAGIDSDTRSPISPRPIKENIVVPQSGMSDIKAKLTNRKLGQPKSSTKMVKAFSQHHLSLNIASPDWNSGKELTSPRSKNRSVSRNNVATTVVTSPVASSNSKPTTRKPKEDKLLFERLAKPRSGSQPPKMISKEPADSPSKIMSTSFNKQLTKSEKVANKDRKLSTSVTSLEPSSQLKETNELTNTQIVLEDVKDMDTTENTNTTTEDLSSANKSGSSKGSKNLIKTPDNLESTTTPAVGEELTYKMKLAEQRRIAREKKEEQLEEKRRIEEEARQKAALEKKRVEEETRKVIEEEAKRAKLIEEEQLAELERQKLIEEAEKKKKDDAQRELEEKRLEELRLAEEERMIRKRKLEMIMRRVKQPEGTNSPSNEDSIGEAGENMISDDKKQDSLMEISLQESTVKSFDSNTRENSPQRTVAWNNEGSSEDQIKLINEKENDNNIIHLNENSPENNDASHSNSPELISDTVLNLTNPETISIGDSLSLPFSQLINTTSSGDQQPKFKSKLLNSMLNKGRLNSSKPQDDRTINSTSTNSSVDGLREKRHSLYISPNTSDIDYTDNILPHSKSYNADLSHLVVNGISYNQAINGLSSESEHDNRLTNGDHHQMDKFSEITLSNSTSNIDPPRISLDKLELCSESTCSQLSSEDCPPPMPSHSQTLELS